MLVPILAGMDSLAKIGLILDFSDGHALHGADTLSEPFVMNKNAERTLHGRYRAVLVWTVSAPVSGISESCSWISFPSSGRCGMG